jgi:RNA polymerase sigma factor (sigma-70 family)
MDVSACIQQSKLTGEYERILEFVFDPSVHTNKLKAKTIKYKLYCPIPDQNRILKPEIEKILLKQYQILRHSEHDQEKLNQILGIIISHRIRFISHVIIKSVGPKFIENYFDLAIIKFYKVVANYNPWREYSISTYLYVCMRRDLISNIKRDQRLKQEGEAFDLLVKEDDCPFARQDTITIYNKLINNSKLTQKQLSILKQVLFEDLAETEVALREGVTRQAISNRYTDAIRKMRAYAVDNLIEIY